MDHKIAREEMLNDVLTAIGYSNLIGSPLIRLKLEIEPDRLPVVEIEMFPQMDK